MPRRQRDNTQQPLSAPPKNSAAAAAAPAVAAKKMSSDDNDNDDGLMMNFTDSWSTGIPAPAATTTTATKKRNPLLENEAIAAAFAPTGHSMSVTRSQGMSREEREKKKQLRRDEIQNQRNNSNNNNNNNKAAAAAAPVKEDAQEAAEPPKQPKAPKVVPQHKAYVRDPQVARQQEAKLPVRTPFDDVPIKQSQQQAQPRSASSNSNTATVAAKKSVHFDKSEQEEVPPPQSKQQVAVSSNKKQQQPPQQQPQIVAKKFINNDAEDEDEDDDVIPLSKKQQQIQRHQQKPQQHGFNNDDDDDDDDEDEADAVHFQQKQEQQQECNEQEADDELMHQQQLFAPTADAVFSQLHPRLLSAVKDKLAFTSLTYVQRASWPAISEIPQPEDTSAAAGAQHGGGGDVVIRSETGSGKTLAYSLPLLHRIVSDADKNRIDRSTGTLMIVLTPTRELAEQCSSVISKLLQRAAFVVVGAIHGGDDRHHEKSRLRKGIHVLVSTPGRLLDHLKQTGSFYRDNLRYLVLDEADRLLDMGFERSLREIMDLLPEPRKRVLVSATVTSAVERLAHFALRPPIITVGNTEDVFEVPDTLAQRFVNVPAKHRLVTLAALLWSRLLKAPVAAANAAAGGQQHQQFHVPHHRLVNADQKIVVFVSTSDAVEFLFLLFSRLASPFAAGSAAAAAGGGGGGAGDAAGSSHSLANNRFNKQRLGGGGGVSVKKLTAEANQHLNHDDGGGDFGGGAKNIVEFGSDDDNEEDATGGFGHQHGRIDPRVAMTHQVHRLQQDGGLSDETAFLRGANIFKLHGNMGQVDRQAVYENFKKATCAVLFCTDVAARGLDIPNVDLIIHYDPPIDEKCYVHRVGRTARIGTKGESVLFVMPHELGFVDFLGAATKRKSDDAQQDGAAAAAASGAAAASAAASNQQQQQPTLMSEVSLDVLLFHLSKMDRKSGPGRHWQHAAAFLQKAMCNLARSDNHIRQVSLFAYQSYIRAYAAVPRNVKQFFDQRELHLGHIASSFANEGTPAQLQRDLRQSETARREKQTARDAFTVRQHGVRIDNTEEQYHSTLLRKALVETKNRVDSGEAGVRQGATAIKGLTEFEA